MKKKIIFLVAFIICVQSAFAQFLSQEDLWKKYNEASPELLARKEVINDLITHYGRVRGEFGVSDTLIDMYISKALNTHNIDLILDSYALYFDINLSIETKGKTAKYLKEIKQLANTSPNKLVQWHATYFESKVAFSEVNFENSREFAQKAKLLATQIDSADLIVLSLIQEGECNDWLNIKTDALRCFLEAIDVVSKTNDADLLYRIYMSMARMFYANKNYQKAEDYYLKNIDIVKAKNPVDSLAIAEINYFIDETNTNNGLSESLEQEIEDRLAYAKKHGYLALTTRYWAMYRTTLLNYNRFGRLYQVYNIKFPEELARIKKEDQELYKRLTAYFFEYQGELDSAKLCWQNLMSSANNQSSVYLKTHMNIRYCEFLLRIGDLNAAYEVAKIAYQHAVDSRYIEYQITTTGLLEEIDLKFGRYKEAYLYGRIKRDLQLESSTKAKQEGLLVMELQHEVERREMVQKIVEEARQADMRAARFKANAFGFGLVVFLVLSALIFRQYMLTNKQKNRSDELLLNILPEETATELKNTGLTTARQYENVTVLFCDIVGFTKVAEQLTPQELVKEIDNYFRAFDDIIGHCGMEKIKTVGDAYVAVGGMPLYNKATACDVVEAAIAMLTVIEKNKQERQNNNKPFYELRVGLHTGSVVAGVVGSKKFQYDIWGDAVNIAARMEQNSEPGRINISEETYLAVKHKYSCSSRGKIDAKNKGLISMYFVDFKPA